MTVRRDIAGIIIAAAAILFSIVMMASDAARDSLYRMEIMLTAVTILIAIVTTIACTARSGVKYSRFFKLPIAHIGIGLMIIQMIVSLGGIDVSGWGPILGYLFASSVRSGVIAMVGSLIIVPAVSAFTRKQDAAQVDEMFECYDVRVSVRQTEALD